MTERRYTIETLHRSGEIRIDESPTLVVVKVAFSRVGELGDEDEILRWVQEVLGPYETDPRPLRYEDPCGEALMIYRTPSGSFISVPVGRVQ